MTEQGTHKMDLDNPGKPRRRFVGLTVREVSLVDSGANEKEFAIIKQKGGHSMADEIKREKQTGGPADVVKTETPDNDTVEPTKEQEGNHADATADIDVQKLADQVSALQVELAELKKGSCGSGSKKKPTTKDEDTDKADESETAKAGIFHQISAGIRGALAKLKSKDIEGAMEDLESITEMLGSYGGGGGYPAASKKAAEVEKAGAKMSKARVEKLSNIFTTMEQAFKSLQELMADVTGAAADADGAAEPIVKADATEAADQIKKAMEPVTKALEGFTEQVKTLTGRVESIEKARGASKGTDDGQEDVVKHKKNFWAGTPVAGVGANNQ